MSTTVTKDITQELVSRHPYTAFDETQEQRQRAINFLTRVGLPGSKHEEYRFTPLTKNLEKHFDLSQDNADGKIDSIDEFLIAGVEANVIVLVNGVYSSAHSKLISPASEITISSLKQACQSHADLISNHLDSVLNPETDAFAALNSAAWQDGVFIHVPAHTQVSTPVFILHVHDASEQQVIAHSKVLAIVERESALSVIERFESIGPSPVFHSFSEEYILKEKATLEYCKIQNDSGSSYQVANTVIHQADNSNVNTFTLTLNGEIVRNNFSITIDGEKCESHFYGLYLLSGNTLADNHTVVDHKKPNAFSNEMYKGIMDGNSKGVFNGKIFVRPHAQKTNAFQSNRNILLSDSATVNTKPQLEIWADDVKCSHGCTSGQLDEEALFYLRSRGIAAPVAKAMLLYAFASEVLEPLQNENLKTYLNQLISERLDQNF